MFKEFKQFAFKGNVVDMAVGVMIGGAFGQIVSSAVNDLFMPLVSLLTGGLDFSNLFIAFDGGQYPSLAAAKEAGAACFAYGSFLTAVLDFLIMALCIFLMVKGINSLRALPKKSRKDMSAPAEKPRLCPYCFGEIHAKATRCPHCTAELPAQQQQDA